MAITDVQNTTGPNNDTSSSYLIFANIAVKYIAPSFLALIFFVGIIGNILVIIVICYKDAMRTANNLLLLNLAVSDMGFLLILVPPTAYNYVAPTYELGDAMCKITQFAMYVLCYVTVYTLVGVSVLRYLTVVWSAQTVKYRTKINVIIFIVTLWIVMLTCNIQYLIVPRLKYIGVWAYCGMIDEYIMPLRLSFFVTAYAVPLVIIGLLYILIIAFLSKNKAAMLDKSSASRERTMHAYRVILAVIVTFAVCWLPLHVEYVVRTFHKLPSTPAYVFFQILWVCMAYSNSAMNPIIYHLGSHEFRKGFRAVICCRQENKPHRRNNPNDTGNTMEVTAMV